MLSRNKKVTIELVNKEKDATTHFEKGLSNPITSNYSQQNKIEMLVKEVLANEIPRLKNNESLFNLISYTVTEKLETVQTVENVLSYIQGNNVKSVQDVSFKNGEVHIKCSI